MAIETSAATVPSPFFAKLVKDVRKRIYKLVLTGHDSSTGPSATLKWRTASLTEFDVITLDERKREATKPNVLALVNRQMRAETHGLFEEFNTVLFTYGIDIAGHGYQGFAKYAGNLVRASRLRRVTINQPPTKNATILDQVPDEWMKVNMNAVLGMLNFCVANPKADLHFIFPVFRPAMILPFVRAGVLLTFAFTNEDLTELIPGDSLIPDQTLFIHWEVRKMIGKKNIGPFREAVTKAPNFSIRTTGMFKKEKFLESCDSYFINPTTRPTDAVFERWATLADSWVKKKVEDRKKGKKNKGDEGRKGGASGTRFR
ncbi:hypothetical protein N0V90_002726 [Kalmusia sp. IMI 367209]|nr:hypothetical protein N0V90_002726 [Kalmusia sp. IMI 367209]